MSMAIISMALALLPATAPSATCGDRMLHAGTVSLTAGDGDVLVRMIGDKVGADDGLRLRLASIARGSGSECMPEAPRLRVEEGLLCFERGAFEERYELRGDGVEQSFVFSELPVGEGDLVVRVEVETTLAVVGTKRDQVSFERADEGVTTRFTLSGIVGIDAAGARIGGSMSFARGAIELRIPESFVRTARLPLVVDPLITGEITLDTHEISAGITPSIGIAYLPDVDRYLAVWRGPDQEVPIVRLVDHDGTPLGIAHHVFEQLSYGDSPGVASVRLPRRFVVVTLGAIFGGVDPWIVSLDEDGTRIAERRISSADGNAIDVAGDMTLSGDDVLVCRSDGAVTLDRIDAVTLVGEETLELVPAGSSAVEVAITPDGGSSGRYLVTWTRMQTGPDVLIAAVVDRELELLVPPFPLADSGMEVGAPDVDGDGTHWVVAYERGQFPDLDIACKEVTYLPSAGSVAVSSERIVAGDLGRNEREPAVAWLGESAVIAWSEHFSELDYDVYMKSVETIGCLDCEGESLVANPPAVDEVPGIASGRGGGGADSEALVTWFRRKPLTGEGFVHARVFRAADGALVDLGGGCGAGGMARATCAASGATNFGVSLDAAAPVQPCGLLLGLDRLDLVCGPCTLVLDPLVAFITTTDASGQAAFTFPMPGAVSFAGAQFLAQWFVRSPSCGNFSFSNALEITVD